MAAVRELRIIAGCGLVGLGLVVSGLSPLPAIVASGLLYLIVTS